MQGTKTWRLLCVLIGTVILWATAGSQISHAEIPSDNAFEGVTWELVREETRVSKESNIQSICCTEDYIICMENISDLTDDPDIITAYYKNDVDENGNPVEQYSLAKKVQETNYEHANGMAYNPNTGEILVSPYTSYHEENKGCIFVMDAKTLTYKDKIKITDDYRILGIGYKEDTNQYVIQTDKDGGYSFKILDANYQVVEDLGKYEDTAKGDNFQDLCVDGDYIINFPLTMNLGIGDYIHMYSISRKALVSSQKLDFKFENITSDEPESICETAPGEFMAIVNTTVGENTYTGRLYKTVIPYNFTITTSAESGTISDVSGSLPRGESQEVIYAPKDGYELTTLTVDGKELDTAEYPDSYTFEDIQNNHTIDVKFTEITFLGKVKSFLSGLIPAKKDTTTAKKPMSEATRNLIVFAVLLLVVLSGLALYIRIIYVRRLRILKRRQANRERRRIIREREELEVGELEDIEMRSYEEL